MKRKSLMRVEGGSLVVKKSKKSVSLSKPVAARINKIIRNIERKTLALSQSTTTGSFSQSGTLDLINGCSQGSSGTTRVGRQTLMEHLELRLFVTGTDAAAPPASIGAFVGICRVMIVYDKQSNGAAPTVGSILESPVATSPLDPATKDRYRVYYDVTKKINSVNQASGDICEFFNINKKLNIEADYGLGNAGTVADINFGSLYLLTICQTSGTQAATPATSWNSTLYFTDL